MTARSPLLRGRCRCGLVREVSEWIPVDCGWMGLIASQSVTPEPCPNCGRDRIANRDMDPYRHRKRARRKLRRATVPQSDEDQ